MSPGSKKKKFYSPGKIYAYNARERARRYHPKVLDWVYPSQVGEKDHWTCQLCFRQVDRMLEFPDDWAPTFDHVKPLGEGGNHSLDNIQLAHRICNAMKGNKSQAEWNV